MALTKKYLKSKPVCKVTFTVPAGEAKTVAVAGDFNAWDTTAKLRKLKSGVFKGSLDVPVDASYEFRYVVDGEWINETEADRYQWNDFAGTENAVLEV
jgi:1,4-alpha-glucan branching enzyme